MHLRSTIYAWGAMAHEPYLISLAVDAKRPDLMPPAPKKYTSEEYKNDYPLHYLIIYRQLDKVQDFLKGDEDAVAASLACVDWNNRTPLQVAMKIDNDAWKMIADKIIDLLVKDKFANNHFSFLARNKEQLVKALCQISDRGEKINYLTQALDEQYSLGRLFHVQRGITKPSLKKGTLKQLKKELDRESVEKTAWIKQGLLYKKSSTHIQGWLLEEEETSKIDVTL